MLPPFTSVFQSNVFTIWQKMLCSKFSSDVVSVALGTAQFCADVPSDERTESRDEDATVREKKMQTEWWRDARRRPSIKISIRFVDHLIRFMYHKCLFFCFNILVNRRNVSFSFSTLNINSSSVFVNKVRGSLNTQDLCWKGERHLFTQKNSDHRTHVWCFLMSSWFIGMKNPWTWS